MNEELKVIISAEVKKLQDAVGKAKKSVSEFANKAKESVKKFGEEFSKVGDAAKKGLAVVGGAIAGAGAALIGMTASTEEYRTAQAKLNTAFETAGAKAGTAKEVYNDLYRVLGDSDVAVEAAGHLAQMTTEEQALSEWTNICQGVYATFGDSIPIEGLTEASNETAKVGTVTGSLADALNWAGINEDAFNEKLAACNDEAEREKLIRETLNGIYSDAAGNYEKNNAALLAHNEAQAKMSEAMARVGEALQPVLTAFTQLGAEVLTALAPYIEQFAAEYLPKITEALSGVGEKIGAVIGWISENWELISTIGTIVLAIAGTLSVLSTAISLVGTVMTIVTSPITLVVLGIAALVAAVVLCIKYWDEIKAKVLEVVNNIVAWVQDMAAKVAEWFGNIKESMTTAITNAKEAVVAKFEEIKTAISEKITAIKEAVANKFEEIKTVISDKVTEAKTAVVDKFNEIKTGVSEKITAVKTSVSDAVTGIVDNLKNKFTSAKDTVLGIFENIKSGLSEKITAAKDAISGVVDKIKGFFDFEFKTPNIPKPSFGITPSGWKLGDLLEGVIPKLSIKWNAEGGVFTRPTLTTYGGSLQGLGENGAEAIVPLEKNTEWLDKIADRLMANQGNTPIVLQVDGKTFAETSIKTINQLTRQTGSLGLNLG